MIINTAPQEYEETSIVSASVTYKLSKHPYDVQLFETDCSTPSTALSMTYATFNDDNSLSEGDGFFDHMKVELSFDMTYISSSSLWTETDDGGKIDFCIRVNQYLDDEKKIQVYFLETIHHFFVDLTTGFSFEAISNL